MNHLFSGPTARFLTGFLLASIVAVAVYAAMNGLPSDFSFLVPMGAIGVVGGVLWVRRPPKFFSKPHES